MAYKPTIKGDSDSDMIYYWNIFIKSAQLDYDKYILRLNEQNYKLYQIRIFIEKNKKFIKDNLNINLDDYFLEWEKGVYNKKETLYKVALRLNHILSSRAERKAGEAIISYCNLLRQVYSTRVLIRDCKKRKNINFYIYCNYVRSYYFAVHKHLLEGDAYKYNNKIGTITLNVWRVDPDRKTPFKFIDFPATKKRKQEVIDAGFEPYDKRKAQLFAVRGLVYKGIPYVVYKEQSTYTQLTLIDSSITGKVKLIFNDREANFEKGGGTIAQMADYIKYYEDLIALRADVKFKAKVMMYKWPETYINLIRHSTALKRYARTHYS